MVVTSSAFISSKCWYWLFEANLHCLTLYYALFTFFLFPFVRLTIYLFCVPFLAVLLTIYLFFPLFLSTRPGLGLWPWRVVLILRYNTNTSTDSDSSLSESSLYTSPRLVLCRIVRVSTLAASLSFSIARLSLAHKLNFRDTYSR